jgi:hypothetical protein
MNEAFIVTLALILVGLPVAGGLLHESYKVRLKHRERMAEALSADTAERAAQYAAKIDRLEQRMQVLERIVTDRGIDVADEIERLRTAPLN